MTVIKEQILEPIFVKQNTIGKRASEWLLQSNLNPERFAASSLLLVSFQTVRKATLLLYLHRRDPFTPPQIPFPLRAATGRTTRGMEAEDEEVAWFFPLILLGM
ncbi:uncharacterized [Tachysurus ichikawai]